MCGPVLHYIGLVEMVQDSSTLRQIQTEHGVTGSFKDIAHCQNGC